MHVILPTHDLATTNTMLTMQHYEYTNHQNLGEHTHPQQISETFNISHTNWETEKIAHVFYFYTTLDR